MEPSILIFDTPEGAADACGDRILDLLGQARQSGGKLGGLRIRGVLILRQLGLRLSVGFILGVVQAAGGNDPQLGGGEIAIHRSLGDDHGVSLRTPARMIRLVTSGAGRQRHSVG